MRYLFSAVIIVLIFSVSATAQTSYGDKEAESQLKKALLMNPEDPKTNLELGIYYYNKDVYPEARDYFETTMDLAPNTEYAAEAKKYLGNMDRRAEKRWRLDTALGLQYDNNVVLGNDSTPLPEGISRKSDWRALLYLKGQYDFLREQNVLGSVNYSFYQSLHSRLSDFNISQHTLGANLIYDLPKITIKGAYAFEYILVGGDAYDFSHTVSPSVTIKEGNGLSTTLQYSYSRTSFKNADLFMDNSDRTGSNNQVSITQNIPIGSSVETRVGYAYDNDNAKKDFWDYSGNKFFVNFGIKLPRNISMDLYGEYYKKDYDETDPNYGKTREDIVHTYSASLSKRLSDRLSISVGEIYIRNKSNIDAFDYKRSITSAYVTARF